MAYLFLSYAKADRETALAIRDVLRREGLQAWMDENTHELGNKHWPTIELNIYNASALVVLVSDEAKKSSWVKRELDFAEKNQKPIFPILIQGEIWPRFGVETSQLGLGLSLDFPDNVAARMKALKSNYADFPPQIPAGTVTRYKPTVIISAVIIVAIIGLLLQIATSLVMDGIRSRDLTQIAQTATESELENIATLETTVRRNLPCSATINFEVVTRGFVTLYTRPTSAYPVAINSSPSVDYSNEVVMLSEQVVNAEGTWYYIRVEYASGNYSGYVLADKVIPSNGCYESPVSASQTPNGIITVTARVETARATSTSQSNPQLPNIAGNRNLICEARVLELNGEFRLDIYGRPALRSNSSYLIRYTSEELQMIVREWIVNEDGTWYYIQIEDLSRSGYVRAEQVVLGDDCPR